SAPSTVVVRAGEDLGLAYTIVNFPEAAYDTSGIELFEREVIPALA
ncbi:LLM class F420-dependent oxidoreductase, partial [Nocardia salmonicida]